MLASFTTNAAGQIPAIGQEPVIEDLAHWMLTITLNVLCGAAFNLRTTWPIGSVEAAGIGHDQTKDDKSSSKKSNEKFSFQQSVDILMIRLYQIIIFPAWMLRNSPLQTFRDGEQACRDFLFYMREMFSDARKTIKMEADERDVKSSNTFAAKDLDNKNDLLSGILKASASDSKMSLTDEETIGNVFLFILAGHETAAGTLQSALSLLATEPTIQQTVQAEIDNIWSTKNPGEDLTYNDYPKMRTLMALMVSLT